MLLARILNFFWGFCIIRVAGSRKERFINLVITEKIPLWDIRQIDEEELWAKVYVSDIGKLRHIARKSRCPFKIIAKRGLPFLLLRAEKRKGLVAGIILFMIMLYGLSSFVWFVDVQSEKPLELLTKEEILAEAESLGLKPGQPKGKIRTDELARKMAVNLPQLTFVSIEIQGTLAKIEVVEKKVVAEEDKERPAHIVAAKDGIIEEILVLAGDPRVKVGDTVQKGQVLISGIALSKKIDSQTGEPIEEGLPKIVEAKGIVRARVWYEAVVATPVIETGQRKTGAKKEQWSVRLGNQKQIIISGPRTAPYQSYEEERQSRTIKWRNLNLPVEIVHTIFYELETYRYNWGREGALKKARAEAIEELKAKMPINSKITDSKVEVLEESDKLIKVRVWIETREDIAVKQYFQPETD